MLNTWSKYNHLFEKEGKFFLFNSLSNSFALLSPDTYVTLKTIESTGDSSACDPDSLSILRKMKAIDVDDEIEISRRLLFEQQRKFDRTSQILTINPTLACNFNCPYCFENQHPDIYMNDEVEDAIIKMIENNHELKHLQVTWFGGEPLLGFNRIVSLSRRFIDILPHYTAAMISNGYLLTEEKIDMFQELHIRSVQITLDGVGESHDSKRCLKDGKPTFKKIVENIKSCRQLAPQVRISIRVNIDRNNIDDYLAVRTFFEQEGIEGLYFSPGFIVDRNDNSTSCCLTNRQIVNFAKDLYLQHGIKAISFFPSSLRNSCSACKLNSMVIGPEGEVYKCWEEVGRPENIMFYIDGRKGISKNFLRYSIGIDQNTHAQCMQCTLLPICDGGCPRVRMLNRYEGK